jgi:hypothetical protein
LIFADFRRRAAACFAAITLSAPAIDYFTLFFHFIYFLHTPSPFTPLRLIFFFVFLFTDYAELRAMPPFSLFFVSLRHAIFFSAADATPFH